MMEQLTPILAVEDIAKSVRFYEQVLGFHCTMTVDANQNWQKEWNDPKHAQVFAIVERDGVSVMLHEKKSHFAESCAKVPEKLGFTGVLYFIVTDIDALYADLKAHFPNLAAPKTQWYNNKEVQLIDNNGYAITFAQRMSPQ